MTHTLENTGRRPIDFHNRVVKEALPEYFTEDFSKLINFLEDYYNFMDSDGLSSFDDEIKHLNNIRDIGETPKEYLDQLISELGAGIPNGDQFTDARFSARRLAEHFRNKGSRFAIEEFFRAFFQQDVTVEYPKKDIFTIGQDPIGYDGQKFIQNYARYQIFSILLKVGLGVPTYRELYKKFAHPAGFYFEGIVAVEGEANLGFNTMPTSIEDSAAGGILVVGEAISTFTTKTNITGLTDSVGTDVRYTLDETIADISTITAQTLDTYYNSIREFTSVNSFTMDDSGNSNTPLMSLTLETMDNNMFTRYTSDSSY